VLNDVARTISTVAIWAAVATVLINLRIDGPPRTAVELIVGVTAFLSTGAAFGTHAIWRASRDTERAKDVPREIG
jgi:hypothetical protein